MKIIPTILCLSVFSSFLHAAAPAVGSISENQQFARKSASGFNTTDLNDYEGSILILMMMTPWCPICQSHAQSVGSGLLDHFDDQSRGSLRGMNDNGVPIRSILLSTEEAASWDGVNESFSTTNGFQQWGLDADTRRMNARNLLGYYRGGFIESSNLYDWGNDRRRVVVLNLVNGSPTHSFREIIINKNSYSSSDNTAARAAINSITPKVATRVPSIGLKHGSTLLESGASTISFGNVIPGGATTLTFTLQNTGGGNLAGIATSLSGTQSTDFALTSPANTSLAADETTTFTVTFKPLADGVRKAVLNLTSTSEDVPSFSINLTGSSREAAPEIVVQQPRKVVLKNERALRKFGSSMIRRNGKTLTFRITNKGDAQLTDLSIAIAGMNPNDFFISSPSKTRLSPGKSTTFDVTFKPRAAGTRQATLQLISNDPDDDPFAITITGRGVR